MDLQWAGVYIILRSTHARYQRVHADRLDGTEDLSTPVFHPSVSSSNVTCRQYMEGNMHWDIKEYRPTPTTHTIVYRIYSDEYLSVATGNKLTIYMAMRKSLIFTQRAKHIPSICGLSAVKSEKNKTPIWVTIRLILCRLFESNRDNFLESPWTRIQYTHWGRMLRPCSQIVKDHHFGVEHGTRISFCLFRCHFSSCMSVTCNFASQIFIDISI
jgi:hypothetical protein